jgi:hypothetical protein
LRLDLIFGLIRVRSEVCGKQAIPDTPATGDAKGGRAFFGGFLRSPGFVILNLSAYAYQEVVSLVLAKFLDQLRHHQKGLRPDFQGGPSGWQSS